MSCRRRRADPASGTPSATARCGPRASRGRTSAASTRAEVDRHAAVRERARLAQLVLEIRVAQVVAVHRPGQVGAVGVPVEQVERRRRLAEQVVVDHVRPDEVVGAQAGEDEREVLARQDAALADRRLARRDAASSMKRPICPGSEKSSIVARNVDARDRSPRFLCARTASAAPSSVPPTQKPSALTLSLSAISCATRKRAEHALLEVVVPA